MDSVRDSLQENNGQAMKTQVFVETKKNAVSYYLCQSDAAAASGLDSRSFQHVVNHDLPKTKSIEEYVRRIGRMKRLDQGMTTVYNQFSLAFTNIAVDECTNVGLHAHGEKLGRVDMNRAADNTRNDAAVMDNTI